MDFLPHIIAIVVFGIVMGAITLRYVKPRTRSVSEVWIVNSNTFAGDDAEKKAKSYARWCISEGYETSVSIPGCKPETAETIWNLN